MMDADDLTLQSAQTLSIVFVRAAPRTYSPLLWRVEVMVEAATLEAAIAVSVVRDERGANADWISGDLGNNTVSSGHWADTMHGSSGTDLVTDFLPSEGDRVEIDPGITYQVSQVDADVHIDLSNGGHLILQNTQLGNLPPGWTIST
jgi:hypothetical protein